MFDDLERDGGKKGTTVEPVQQNRAIVQELGNLGIRFPMTLYIAGMDYHKTADAFFVALSEPCDSDSPATLNHPRWGDILVCPEGNFTQVEGFVENMGRAVFTVTFVRIDRKAKFPGASKDAGSQLQADSDAAKINAANTFEGNYPSPPTPSDLAAVGNSAGNFLTAFGDSVRGLTSLSEEVSTQFEAGLATALGSLGALASDPAAMADGMLSLVLMPAGLAVSIAQKVGAFRSAIEGIGSMIGSSDAEAELKQLIASAIASGATESTLEGDLLTRQDAINTAEDLDALLASLLALIETAEETGWIADSDTVATITDLLSVARSRLVDQSFSLKSQRTYTVSVPTDPNTILMRLYGTWSDSLLDQFCMDNDLADDEFFMLPAGRTVVWYA